MNNYYTQCNAATTSSRQIPIFPIYSPQHQNKIYTQKVIDNYLANLITKTIRNTLLLNKTDEEISEINKKDILKVERDLDVLTGNRQFELNKYCRCYKCGNLGHKPSNCNLNKKYNSRFQNNKLYFNSGKYNNSKQKALINNYKSKTNHTLSKQLKIINSSHKTNPWKIHDECSVNKNTSIKLESNEVQRQYIAIDNSRNRFIESTENDLKDSNVTDYSDINKTQTVDIVSNLKTELNDLEINENRETNFKNEKCENFTTENSVDDENNLHDAEINCLLNKDESTNDLSECKIDNKNYTEIEYTQDFTETESIKKEVTIEIFEENSTKNDDFTKQNELDIIEKLSANDDINIKIENCEKDEVFQKQIIPNEKEIRDTKRYMSAYSLKSNSKKSLKTLQDETCTRRTKVNANKYDFRNKFSKNIDSKKNMINLHFSIMMIMYILASY